MLANTLLARARRVRDRRSAEGLGQWLPGQRLAPRNLLNLQTLLPKYMFVPPSGDQECFATCRRVRFGGQQERGSPERPCLSTRCSGAVPPSASTGTPVVETGAGQRTDLLGLHGSSPARIVLEHVNHEHDTDHALRGHDTDDNEYDCDHNEHDSGDREHDSADSSTTPSTTSSVAQAATAATTTSTTETAAQAVVAAVTQLANAQSASANSPNNLAPAGTLTPVTTEHIHDFRHDRRLPAPPLRARRRPRQVPRPRCRPRRPPRPPPHRWLRPRQVPRP